MKKGSMLTINVHKKEKNENKKNKIKKLKKKIKKKTLKLFFKYLCIIFQKKQEKGSDSLMEDKSLINKISIVFGFLLVIIVTNE